MLDGLTTASVSALHTPFLMDSYPPETRVRVLSYYQGANSFGNVLAPLLVAALAGWAGLTWRGVFIVLGLTSLAATLTTTRLKDPGFGRFDTDRIRRAVREREGQSDLPEEREVSLGFFEIVQRLTLIPSIRRLLAAEAVLGVLLIPYQTFLAFFLDERWNVGPAGQGPLPRLPGGRGHRRAGCVRPPR